MLRRFSYGDRFNLILFVMSLVCLRMLDYMSACCFFFRLSFRKDLMAACIVCWGVCVGGGGRCVLVCVG